MFWTGFIVGIVVVEAIEALILLWLRRRHGSWSEVRERLIEDSPFVTRRSE